MSDVKARVTWLRAQLNDDEWVARAALAEAPGLDGRWLPTTTRPSHIHEARWDPARVLTEVETKRRILDLHVPVDGYDPNGLVCSTCGEAGNPGDETTVVRWPCPTVRLLARPHAGRDGWREEWRA